MEEIAHQLIGCLSHIGFLHLSTIPDGAGFRNHPQYVPPTACLWPEAPEFIERRRWVFTIHFGFHLWKKLTVRRGLIFTWVLC
jgi:hypothetical protein